MIESSVVSSHAVANSLESTENAWPQFLELSSLPSNNSCANQPSPPIPTTALAASSALDLWTLEGVVSNLKTDMALDVPASTSGNISQVLVSDVCN